MRIPFSDVAAAMKITGILHVGAHECQERKQYHQLGLTDNDIVWIEGNERLVAFVKTMHPQIYMIGAMVDEVQQERTFYITNNGQSSSILELGTHKEHHPTVQVIGTRQVKTTTIDTIVNQHALPIEKLNLWVLDIQGAELLALKGATESLKKAQGIYIEVNIEQVYKGCALLPEIEEFLVKAGFQKKQVAMTPFGYGDAFFLRS